jgi:hypothetical protein
MTLGEKAKHKYLKRRAYQDAYNRKRKENETPEQREKRLEYQQVYQRKRKENETLEQKEKRLKYHREYKRKLREMRRRVINRPNNLTYAEEMELEQKQREKVNAAYAKKPKKPRKKRTSFPLAQKAVVELPKINPDNNKYRKVVKKAAQAYRALSPEEKLERIRIAYRWR